MNFKGFGENVATFFRTDDTVSGQLLAMASSEVVRPAQEGEPFIGICIGVRDKFAAVQLAGYVEAFSPNRIPVGYRRLVAEHGGLSEAANGRAYRVITEQETDGGYLVGFLL